MKKASSIILMISGIVDIVAASLLLLSAVLTFWLIFPLFFILPAVMLLVSGILALKARKNNKRGTYIANIVFAVLSCMDPLSIIGDVLGIIYFAKHPDEVPVKPVEEEPAEEAAEVAE